MILHYGDLIDGNCLVHIINTTKPTEIYNLGAQSHVKVVLKMMKITAEFSDDSGHDFDDDNLGHDDVKGGPDLPTNSGQKQNKTKNFNEA